MKLVASRELYAYWSQLRRARSAPERSQIDPTAIPGLLADTFILEVDPRAGYPFRIAGARTSSLFLTELRGRPFLALWAQSSRQEVANILTTVVDEATPAVSGVAAKPAGLPTLELELLLLPLRHHGATHARVLGLCSPAVSPSWLGLVPVGPMTIVSSRFVLADNESGAFATPNAEESLQRVEVVARQLRLGRFTMFSSRLR
jgi:hypothetical protein